MNIRNIYYNPIISKDKELETICFSLILVCSPFLENEAGKNLVIVALCHFWVG